MKLLTTGNPKIAKGLKLGYLTNILHLAPSNLSGNNVCPMATPGCKAACLNTAGRGGLFAGQSHLNMSGRSLVTAVKAGNFRNAIQNARIDRTNFYFQDRPAFMRQLYKEIKNAIKSAKKHGLTPVFRLNGTSDLRWENTPVTVTDKVGTQIYNNLMAAFPHIQFYDYTKIVNRRDIPSNYHLTFSLAESNDADAVRALHNGMNVAAVFRTKTLPSRYTLKFDTRDWAVVNGDESDLRFLDPTSVIVGLKAKGKGKKDKTGFVRDV